MFVRDNYRMAFLALVINSMLAVSPHVESLALAVGLIHSMRQYTFAQLNVRRLVSKNLTASIRVLVTSRIGVFPIGCTTLSARGWLSSRQRSCLKLVECKWGHLAHKVVISLVVHRLLVQTNVDLTITSATCSIRIVLLAARAQSTAKHMEASIVHVYALVIDFEV